MSPPKICLYLRFYENVKHLFIKTYEISHFIVASTCHGSAKDRAEEVTHEPLHAVDPVNLGNNNNDNDNDDNNDNI